MCMLENLDALMQRETGMAAKAEVASKSEYVCVDSIEENVQAMLDHVAAFSELKDPRKIAWDLEQAEKDIS